MRNRAGLQTRHRILTATRTLLSEKGFDGVTVKGICDAARIQAGSFYNLFSSKDEVVLEVVREAITAVDPDPEGAGTDTLEDLVEAYVRFVEGQEDLARVYLILAVGKGLTDPAMAHRMLRHHHRRVERFTAALLRRQPELTVEEAMRRVEALVAALNGYAFHRMLDPGFDFAGHARRLLTEVPATS